MDSHSNWISFRGAGQDEVHGKKRLRERLEAAGVLVFDGSGEARFAGENSLALGDGRRLEAEKLVLCARGHARRLGLPGGELALTHSDVWTMGNLPRSVAVVGAAARRMTRTLGFIPLARAERDGNEQLRAAEWELRSG